MTKVTPIEQRKDAHIKINLEKDVRSGLTSGLEEIHLTHEALPELNLDEIDTRLNLFGRSLTAPLLISSMTGGTRDATSINQRLAEAAQECQIAMGIGSQRAAIEDSTLVETFSISRKSAPSALLFANLGAIQLNYGYGLEECQRAVDMLAADALYLHLNPLQEAVQHGGDLRWSGLAKKIEQVCRRLPVPVIAKEVGWGISPQTAQRLADCGVAAIDVAGAGGTSWSQVEMHRAPNEFLRALAASFVGWGIPTAQAIRNVRQTLPGMTIFASGGLKDGLDIAKCLALGATLGGMAGQFLKAAAVSTENVIETIHLTREQLKIALFCAGAANLSEMNESRLAQ